MTATRKGLTQVSDQGARAALESLSKFAVIDLVVDLVRQNEGKPDLDGFELVAAVRKAFDPIASVRGDRLPQYPKR